MKIVSWNVNGVRAVAKKGFDKQVKSWNADIICLQETKAQDDEVHSALAHIEGYHVYPHSAVRKGYAGTCIMTKQKPLSISYGVGIHDHDQEGRTITSEFDDFYLVTSYIPNSGSDLSRLDYRQVWDKDFRNFLCALQNKKPVIACGDFNVAHQPIDLARPKQNYNKTSGYTQKEIDGMSELLKAGFVDIYRHLKPTEIGYSWWSARFGARAKNIGWRIDYFIVSASFIPNIVDTFILPEEMGSDHCPVVLVTK